MADNLLSLTTPEDNVVRRMIDEKLAREDAAFKAATEVNKSIPAADQAKAIPLAKENNVPTEVARRNLRELEAQKRQDNLRNIMLRSTSVNRLAADQDHGPIALEHADEIDQFETALKAYKGDGVLLSLGKGVAQSAVDVAGGFAQFIASTGSNISPYLSGGLSVPTPTAVDRFMQSPLSEAPPEDKQAVSKTVTKLSSDVEKAIAYTPITDWERDLKAAFQRGEYGSALANVPGFAGEQLVVGLPNMLLAWFAPPVSLLAETGRVAQERAQNDGRDYVSGQDIAAAAPVGALITFGERFGLGKMLNPGTGLMAPVRGAVAEGGTEFLQESGEYLASTLGTQKGATLGGALEAGTAGFIGGAPGGAIVAGGKAVLDAYVFRAEKRRQDLVDLGDKIRSSKVANLSPDTLTALAQQIEADGGPQMSVPAEKLVQLFQSEGFTPEQIKQQFPEVAKALDDAEQGNAEVPLNAESIVKLVSLEGFEAISGDVRTGPNERTPNELKQDAKDFDAFVESLSDTEKKEAVRASIEAQLTKQLTAAGQEPRAAAVQARLWSSILTNIDERNAKDPGATLARYRLDITNNQSADTQAVPDAVMMQSAKDAGYGEPAIRVNGQVLKASDFFPNWEKGSRPEAGRELMSIADEQAMGDVDLGPGMPDDPFWGHTDLLAKAREIFGRDVVDAAIESDPEAGFGMVNSAGDFRSLKDFYRQPAGSGGESTLFQSEQDGESDVQPDLPPGEPVAAEAVNTASLESGNALSKSKVWQTGRDLKLALQNAILSIVNGRNLLERTAANRAYLIEVGFKDGLAALEQNANAIGWYDLKTRQALGVMSLVHPELATDETSRFAFTWALAVTSNGIKVGKNFELAEMVYSRWKASDKDPAKRKMPTDIKAGKAQGPINDALGTFNDLSEAWGLKTLRLFMLSNFKAGDIKAMTGIMPAGEWTKTDVRGASIIGPKIGNGFFSNLYGKFDALTMDRWLVRTWGRWTGTLIEIDQPNVDKARTRLEKAVGGVDKKALAAALREVKKTDKKGNVSEIKPGDRDRLIAALEGSDLDAISDAVLRASQEPKFRKAMNDTTGGEELRKAGNSLAKYLDGQKEQPEGPGERVYIREIFGEMLKRLQQDPRFADLTMSDLQAVLWYAEKRLYETAKEDIVAEDIAKLEGDEVAGYDDDDAPDYANAAADVARSKGVSDRRITAALKKEENRGRSGTAQPADGGTGQVRDQQAGESEQGQARGFTAGERKDFVQRRALDRVRSNRSGDAEQSWSYSRGSRKDGGGVRLLRKLGKGVTSIADWAPGKNLKATFARADISAPTFHELEPGSAENAARFASAISTARDTLGAIGKAVAVYPAESYGAMRLFLSEDGNAGFGLKPDGDIVSVFSAKGSGAGRAIMETAIAAGGKKLDAFATILPEFYSAHGFRAVARIPWDEREKPDGWDKEAFAKYNNGEPDVVFMVYDPQFRGHYDASATKQLNGKGNYGRGVTAQGRAITEMETKASSPGPSSSQVTTLNQNAQSTTTFARGFIKFGPGRDFFQITLTGKADLSTFNHEMMHYALEVIQDLVQKGEASPQLVADLQKLREFAGLEEGEPIERRHHEQIARAWEAYVMEGRSPSADLQSVFNRMRAWMVFIYKRLAALDVELTDEVRGVFDRLVASDAQIAEARTQIGWSKPLPKEALYLSDDEYDRYVEAWNKASEAQQREVDAKLMLEAARETQAAWREERAKVMEEEQKKLAATRGHRAWKLLSEGIGLDDAAPGRTSLKIDPETVPPEWRRDTTGMTEEGGLPLEAVAEILGFDSGEQMISLIAGSKFAERDLPAKVRQIMAERHGDMDATALADVAMAAVHSDDTQEVLLTEFRAMAQKAGIPAPPPGLSKWMAAQAEQKVRALTRRQLDPTRWRRAELKAATDAAKAAAKGDVAKAAIHKRQQMMAAAMYRATVQADKRVDVIRKKLLPFTKNDRRAKLGKAGDLYLDGIDEILEGVQLKQMSAKAADKITRLEKLVEEANANGEPLVLPDKLRAMLGKKNFADMTLEELEGVHDSVMNIWHLAKLKNELKARNEKRELEEALTEMEANAQAALGDPKVQVLFTEGWKERATNTLRKFRAGLTKMEFLFGWLDGKPDGGLMHRLIYQPIADANHEKFKIMRRFHETIIERMRNLPNEQKARWESKRTFMGNSTANGATIISAALNLGNEGNKKKLLEGYGWNEQQLMAEINAFMTKADWDFVQHVWDEIDTLWPKIEATTKAATGLAPEKVVASPVVTPFGTYAGGYYPVVYDPNQTEQQFKNQQQGEGLFTNNFARPTLGDGFTKARVDYAAPLLLKLDVISRHLAEVVHYVTHYEAVTQADKITRHPRFQALVKGHMGKEFYRYIRPWLQDVARDQDTPAVTNMEPFAQAARYLRGGVSIGAMGYNIFTGLKQLIGIVQSLDAIGPRYWLQGLSESWLSPNAIANWKEAFSESQELWPLVTQFDRDIKMINDAYAKQGAMSIPSKVASWAFKHIGWLQAAVNVATWRGAYAQEFSISKDHQKAVMHADAVVRKTQSAGAVKDLSPIQRGSEINRAVSMFYSWFNVLYNRLEDIAKQTKGVKDVPRAAARVAILVMMSSMVEEAGRRAWEAIVDNYEDDEEEAGYILSVLMKSADTLVGAIPMARVFASAGAAAGGLPPELFPAGRVVSDYYRTIGAARDFITKGEAPSRGEVKTAVRTVSALTHVPLSGPYNFLDEIFGEAVFGEGKKTKP